MDKQGLILLSGGLDSVVSLAVAKEEYNINLALSFDYGQRAREKELAAAQKIAEYYEIDHIIIKLDWLKDITKTALVDKTKTINLINEENLDDLEEADNSARKVWVPNRNGVMINIAASFADSFNYTHIVFGANKEEGTTFPDNTQEYIDRVTASLGYSTLAKPSVIAPLINLDKTEIIKLGMEKNVPFNLIRSCYEGYEKHCGACESCKRLKRALESCFLYNIVDDIFI